MKKEAQMEIKVQFRPQTNEALEREFSGVIRLNPAFSRNLLPDTEVATISSLGENEATLVFVPAADLAVGVNDDGTVVVPEDRAVLLVRGEDFSLRVKVLVKGVGFVDVRHDGEVSDIAKAAEIAAIAMLKKMVWVKVDPDSARPMGAHWQVKASDIKVVSFIE
jgi:Xaa-Pro aminopeptidase